MGPDAGEADQLETWDFQDPVANGAEALVNRQKSALNLVSLEVDEDQRTGIFFDREKKTRIKATLASCECRDFLFVGQTRRRRLQPCKHIYRLAIELGLLEPKHLDHKARQRLHQHRLDDLQMVEDHRLACLGRDPGQWGQWPAAAHQSGLQRNRQYRAYFIQDDEPERIHRLRAGWRIRGHVATLEECDCSDFCARRLPCKHIYTVALASGLSLPLGRSEYLKARDNNLRLVFEFPVEDDQP